MENLTKWCPRCQAFQPLVLFGHRKDRRNGLAYKGWCNPCYSANSSERARQRRADLLEAMGNKCVCCGFDDCRALQVDHVHGGGRRERELLRFDSPTFYKRILANPNDYQLLCANCNSIKRIEEQEAGRWRREEIPS